MDRDRLEAFQEIYNACYGELYRFVKHTSDQGQDEETERIVADLFVLAHRLFPQYNGESSYRAWLYSVAVEGQSGGWKRLRGKKSAMQPVQGAVFSEGTVRQGEESAEDRTQRLIEEVLTAFSKLPQRERQVIVLEQIHRFSRPELALIFNRSEGRVQTLAEEAMQRLLQGIESEAQGLVEEALTNHLAYPTDLELLERRTRTLDAVLKRSKRANLRKKWIPVAVIAVLALSVTGALLLPEQLKETVTPPPVNLTPVTEMIQVPLVSEQASAWEWMMERSQHYLNLKMTYVYSPQRHQVDIVKQGDKLYGVKWQPNSTEGEKKLLMQDGATRTNFKGGDADHMIFGERQTIDGQMVEQLYVLRMADLSLTPLPISTKGQQIESATVINKGTPIAYFLFEDQGNQEKKLYAYDLNTGEEKLLQTLAPERQLSWMNAINSNLFLHGPKEVQLLTDEGLKTVLQNESGVHVWNVFQDKMLYQIGMMDEQTKYRESAKAMIHNLKTGESMPALPNQDGTQKWMYTNKEDQLLLSNFVASKPLEDPALAAQLPGVIELWEVDLTQAKTQKLYQIEGTWEQYNLHLQPVPQTKDTQLYLKSTEFNKIAMLYDMEKRTIVPVDPNTVPKLKGFGGM